MRAERGGRGLKVEDACDMQKEMDFSVIGNVKMSEICVLLMETIYS